MNDRELRPSALRPLGNIPLLSLSLKGKPLGNHFFVKPSPGGEGGTVR